MSSYNDEGTEICDDCGGEYECTRIIGCCAGDDVCKRSKICSNCGTWDNYEQEWYCSECVETHEMNECEECEAMYSVEGTCPDCNPSETDE